MFWSASRCWVVSRISSDSHSRMDIKTSPLPPPIMEVKLKIQIKTKTKQKKTTLKVQLSLHLEMAMWFSSGSWDLAWSKTRPFLIKDLFVISLCFLLWMQKWCLDGEDTKKDKCVSQTIILFFLMIRSLWVLSDELLWQRISQIKLIWINFPTGIAKTKKTIFKHPSKELFFVI